MLQGVRWNLGTRMIKARHYINDVGARGKETRSDGDETYKSDCETLARPISTTGKAKQARSWDGAMLWTIVLIYV